MRSIFFVCSGLGIVKRGFETYIAELADVLIESKPNSKIEVYSGGRFFGKLFTSKKMFVISRNNSFLNLFCDSKTTSELELYTFFISFLIPITFKKPAAIYLGEYRLYCYLLKWRNLFHLDYSLILYTGGQVYPSLYDIKKDYVHHVTDIYVEPLMKKGFPKDHQFILPHFIQFKLTQIDQMGIHIKNLAGDKKIIISVGLIDKKIKRMDLLVELLVPYTNKYFLVMLGAYGNDTKSIHENLIQKFGTDNFYLGNVSREHLFSFLSVADAFVLLSPKESFGLAYLEALSMGVPVICSDFYESRYVLKDFAYFIKEEELSKLSYIIDNQIENDTVTLKANRRRFVQSHYSWENLKNQYLNMFEYVMNHHP